jgi:UDP-glucose 4-epimerase
VTGVVITGAGGYLGGRLVRHLADDHTLRLRALTRRAAPWLPPAAEQLSLDLLGPPEPIKEAFADADAVIHLAGANEVRTEQDPDRAVADTIGAARRVALAARDVGVARLIYISTVHVYDGSMAPGSVLTEELTPNPRNLYAVARLASEHAANAVTADSETGLVVLRLTNVVGAPPDVSVERWSLLSNDLCRQAITAGRLELRTHGAQWRDFIAMTDTCRIIAAAVPRSALEASIPTGTFNVGRGEAMRVRELAGVVQAACEAATGRRPPLVAPPLPASPPGPYHVSVRRVAELGLGASASIRGAVDETIRFCQANRGTL